MDKPLTCGFRLAQRHPIIIARDPDDRWHSYRPDGTEILLHPLIA